MGRVNTPMLMDEQRIALENEFKNNQNHTFRGRCESILLKAAGRTSKDVGTIVGMCHVSVNSWLKRYQQEGMAGLTTKLGRGRKAILNKVTDEAAIMDAVKTNRQRISLAKAEWEAQRQTGSKAVGRDTFRNFLKVLVADTNAFGDE